VVPSAGANAVAAELNYPITVSAKDSATTDGTTSSTTFVNSLTTTTTRGIAFTAGASGAVLVFYQCTGRNSLAGQFTIVDFEVRTGTTVGSGTVVRASDESSASAPMSDSINQQMQHNGHDLVTGLTPGNSYNATMTYRVTGAATGTFNRRKITVQYTW
jgi:hypothetical protein